MSSKTITIKWKDATKGVAGSPRILHIKIGHIHVMVRQYAGRCDTWYVTIKEFDIQRLNLDIADEEAAKARAMLLLQGLVQKQISRLQAIEEAIYTNAMTD